MKFGFRKPNLKKRVKAKTTGKLKRAAKRSVNPMYGKKGMGLVNNPKKAVYNKVYNKTTISVDDILKKKPKKSIFGKPKYSQQEISLLVNQAKRNMEIYNDSQKLFNETSSPDVFLSRYDLALEHAVSLNDIIEKTDNAIGYSGTNVKDIITTLQTKKDEVYNDFLQRYKEDSKQKALVLKTEKGRINNFNRSLERLLNYENKFNKSQIEQLKREWDLHS